MTRWAILVAMLLAGCADERNGYPSLAHRPVEDATFDEPARAVPAPAADPALDAQIATMSTTLTEAAAAFDKVLPAIEKRATAAQGSPAGSDAWIDAQQGLATLDDSRARVAALATDIDTAAAARAARLEPAYPALDALGSRGDVELARERAAIERLQAILAPG